MNKTRMVTTLRHSERKVPQRARSRKVWQMAKGVTQSLVKYNG